MKRISCAVMSAVLVAGMVMAPASAANFADIEGHWGQSAIQQVTDWNLFAGTGEGTFSPDMTMTRGMFVTVLAQTARLLEVYQEPAQNTGFEDVSAGDYFAVGAAWAKENGLVAGVDESHFAPHAPITREQMCVIMAQFLLKFTTYDPSTQTGEEPHFLDQASIHDYAADGVSLCASLGLIRGVEVSGGVEFQPNQPATRAAVAVVLEHLVEVAQPIVKQPDEEKEDEPKDEEELPGGGTQTPGGDGEDGYTEGERQEEAQMAGYLQIMLDNYQSLTVDFLPTVDPQVQNCMAILMGCIRDALGQREKGQFLDRAYVQTRYAGEIQQLKTEYDGLTEEQLTQINNVIVRLASSEQIYFVMDYFGVENFG